MRNFQAFSDCQVTAVDLESGRLEKLSRADSRIAVARNFESTLADPLIDAVVIATPTSTHFEIARRALLAGKVACECELMFVLVDA